VVPRKLVACQKGAKSDTGLSASIIGPER
jgi:hypothetical protein